MILRADPTVVLTIPAGTSAFVDGTLSLVSRVCTSAFVKYAYKNNAKLKNGEWSKISAFDMTRKVWTYEIKLISSLYFVIFFQILMLR